MAEIYDSDISFKSVCETRAALHSRAPLESSGEGYVTSMGHPSVAGRWVINVISLCHLVMGLGAMTWHVGLGLSAVKVGVIYLHLSMGRLLRQQGQEMHPPLYLTGQVGCANLCCHT